MRIVEFEHAIRDEARVEPVAEGVDADRGDDEPQHAGLLAAREREHAERGRAQGGDGDPEHDANGFHVRTDVLRKRPAMQVPFGRQYRRCQFSIALKLRSATYASLSFGSMRPYSESTQSSERSNGDHLVKHSSKTAALAFGVAILFGSVAVGFAQTDTTSSNTTSKTTTTAPAPAVQCTRLRLLLRPPPMVVAAPAPVVVAEPATTTSEHHSSSSSDSSPSGNSTEHSSSTSTSNY